MMKSGFPRDLCGYVAAAVLFVLAADSAAGAQEPFISYNFDTDDLDDFFLPIGFNFCGDLLPTGTAEISDGQMVLSTDDNLGIGMTMLLPEVVEHRFPDSRDAITRVRFSIDAPGAGGQPVTQFALGLRGRVGVEPATRLIHSEFEQAYYVSVVPEFVDPVLTDGYIAISEFSRCHEHIGHPEWPGGDGFAAVPAGIPIIAAESYWLEATAIGDDDGGPVEISVKLWRDGDDPAETPQLSVVDPDGLPHTVETLSPETDLGILFGLNFDLEPRPLGASVRIDRISMTEVGAQETEKLKFRRGDANDDGAVNITDGVFVLNFLFTELVNEVPCPESSDANDDGGINISDGLFILNYLFVEGGLPPPPPGPDACGENPVEEDMTECAYTSC